MRAFGRVVLALKDGKKFAVKEVNYIHINDNVKKIIDSQETCLNRLKDSCPYLVNFFESFRNVSIIILFIIYLLKGPRHMFSDGVLRI
jgi:hypothetical protein